MIILSKLIKIYPMSTATSKKVAIRPWITASKLQMEFKTPPEAKNPVYLKQLHNYIKRSEGNE